MSVDLTLKRKEGATADLSKWAFGNNFHVLESALRDVLGKSLDVVFSDVGALATLEVRDSRAGLQVLCEIEIEDCEAYASAKVSLRSLILSAFDEDSEDADRHKMAVELRVIADSIDPKSEVA